MSEQFAIDGGGPVATLKLPIWPQFEKAWAKWLGVGNAISVTNGTVAFHVALGGLNIGPGDESGMVVTNDDDLAWEFRSFRDHGYDVRAKKNLLEMEGKQLYIHRRVGFNFCMTEMQSMIGLCELENLDTWNLPARRRNGRYLIDHLANQRHTSRLSRKLPPPI
ncbi:MAG: DegT/DnrJ/EryC1/StrS family aminotransferase [Victivallales bacterium]|nr:DegT/DnrJ/EryC1/StrS family aminotransferase [Victivallales bacterium]